MKYAFDSGRWSATESWRTIRTVRAEPPAAIAPTLKGERRVVFQAALEQAQQQFAAAAAVGYESRALNLFYGLSQAGRALAAASDRLGPGMADDNAKRWQSTSHGLAFALTQGDFWHERVKVEAGRSDTFTRTSIALGSSYDFESIELGALAAQIPEFAMEWRTFDHWPRSLNVDDSMGDWANGVFDLREYRGAVSLAALEEYVGHYPALHPVAIPLGGDGLPADRTGDGLYYTMVARPEDYLHRPRKLLSGARPYGGSYFVFPQPDGASGDLHPLMAWWQLLFGFSILARYHPKQWTEALAIGTSPIASQIEFLLDAAVAAVPELLAREWWEPPTGW